MFKMRFGCPGLQLGLNVALSCDTATFVRLFPHSCLRLARKCLSCVMFLWACMIFTSRERKYPRNLVMGKFQNLMEQVTTKTWSKLLKETLYQGIQAFIGMRIFSTQVFLLVWKRSKITHLQTPKIERQHNLLQIGKNEIFCFNSLLIWLKLCFCC